jgi:ribose-phosphate pyrophosphokinase
MQTINLSKTFHPYGEGVADISRPFPSVIEANILLDKTALEQEILIVARIEKSEDIWRLLLATDASRRSGAKKISVFIPYLPYARQDRQCRPGEAFSLEVLAQVLNLQNYENVFIYDPHSAVTQRLIHNAVPITNHSFVEKVLLGKEKYLLVSPDAGTSIKIDELALAIGYDRRIVQCRKHRIPGGSIDTIEVSEEDFCGLDLYIVDDICDGGATFIKLAEVLRKRNAGTINLIVSHGIFSKGLEALTENGIDHVYTTDSFADHTENNALTEVKLCSILM